MSVVVFGLNHKTAPLELLERAAVPPEDLPKALASLTQRRPVREAAVLSTCNRLEVYAVVSRYHEGMAAIRDFVAEWSGTAPEDLSDRTYDAFDEGAAAHLFAVVAGLDSMVVGERQIALQVKDAYARAEAEGACGRVLHALFRRALRVGKRARAETGVSKGASSILEAGLEAAAGVIGPLDGRTALVVGAGKIGGMTVGRLARDGARVLVVNRSTDKLDRLVDRYAVDALGLDDLEAGLAAADLVVCSTAAAAAVIGYESLERVMRRRQGRPLAILDLAVPRDVDPACRGLAGVALLDIEAVRRTIERGRGDDSGFSAEIAKARALTEEQAGAFAAWMREAAVEPTIAALRARAEAVRRAEVERYASRLTGLDDEQRRAVEALTKGVVNTFLHEPTVRLKAIADAEDAPHPAVVRDLFDLDPEQD